MAEAKCTHPPRGEADAYHIAEALIVDGSKSGDILYERIVRERKLSRAEAVMLSSMALKFSRKYQADFEGRGESWNQF